MATNRICTDRCKVSDVADVYADFQLRCSGQKWVVLWRSMSFIVELPDSVAEALLLAPPYRAWSRFNRRDSK